LKFDTINKQSLIWAEENVIPSEPVFIGSPNSNPEIEDEGLYNFNVSYLVIILIILIDLISGVILSLVLSELDETKAYLLVLDAKSFKEIARASFQTKSSIPGDFHGIFIP